MIPTERLNEIIQRFECLEAKLNSNPELNELKSLGQEYHELRPVIEKIKSFKETTNLLEETKSLLSEPEMKFLAQEEIGRLEIELADVEKELLLALIPKDQSDKRSVILEVRAGTGGDEASLFALNLIKMYQRFAELNQWNFQIIEQSMTEIGGIRELIANITGSNVFGKLKFESGVHRVQRVPETESSGRVHTSAATVAVLPEANEVDVEINPSEIRIDTMRASGAGGQHVNTTDSAVRVTHLPTGIVVTSSEKSQHQNRAKAMQVLRTRLFDMQTQKIQLERAENRKVQVGTGDRSERIRTYNFPQGRVTDHRINLTLYKLEEIIAGNLTDIVNGLIASENAQKLSEISRND